LHWILGALPPGFLTAALAMEIAHYVWPRHRRWLCLEHNWDGRILYDNYVRETLVALNFLWQQPVVLSTKTKNGDEFVYVCESTDSSKVHAVSRQDYDNLSGA
jgi:hypothetical protein